MDTGTTTDRREVPRLLCALALLTVPPYALWRAFGLLFTLFGESPSAAEQAEADRWLALGVGVALTASLLGLLLSLGRRGWLALFGSALLLAVVCGGALADPAPAPAPPAPGCVERSGGEATCPGG